MKPLLFILAALCFAGCSARHVPPPPQTASVRASGRVVSERLGSATSRARVLHDGVSVDLKPAVGQLLDDLKVATEAKVEQDKAVEVLERDIIIQTAQLTAAREERDSALTSRNRWRKYTAWLGFAALGMLLFIFRKPLMRLLVGPIPI